MPEFKSVKQLEAYLKKMIKDSMNDVGKHVEKRVREHIDEDVYNAYPSPSVYERTYELKNSLGHSHAKEVGNEIITEVEHNNNLISSEEPNKHMSVIDGTSSAQSIAEIVHDGKTAHIWGENDKYTFYKPRPYMDNARDELRTDKSHIDILESSLQKKGLKVER